MSQSAQPAAFGRGYLESRTATQDGYIWPFERRQMVSHGPIRERMVEDIGRLVHDGGEDAVVSQADLIRLGWPAESVMAHATHAFQSVRKLGRRGVDRSISPARLAAEACALSLFVACVTLVAGVSAGAI